MLDQHGLLKKLALGADTFVGEDRVYAEQKQVPLQASVVWDSAVQEGLDVPPCVDVIWDEGSGHDLDLHGLLQDLAIGGERNPAGESFTDGLPSHTVYEVFEGMPNRVVWDEMPADFAVHDGFLKQLA